jgi:hypothetical protein
VIYWLVLFSIVVHGLSIPLLDVIFQRIGVAPIMEDAVSVRRKSVHQPPPTGNATPDSDDDAFIVYNRFIRPKPDFDMDRLPTFGRSITEPNNRNADTLSIGRASTVERERQYWHAQRDGIPMAGTGRRHSLGERKSSIYRPRGRSAARSSTEIPRKSEVASPSRGSSSTETAVAGNGANGFLSPDSAAQGISQNSTIKWGEDRREE